LQKVGRLETERPEVRSRTDRARGPAAGAESRIVSDVPRIALFVAGYTAAYFYAVTFSEAYPSPFWIPDAVLLCALLLTERRTWWIYLLLALPIRLWLQWPWKVPFEYMATTYVNDAVKAFIAAAVLRYLKPKGTWFSSSRDFVVFGWIAVLGVPALSALGGAASRHATGPQFWLVWTEWFLGDALANLILTPLILSFAASAPVSLQSWRRKGEAGLLVVGLLVSGAIAFRGGTASFPIVAVVLCLPFPFLLWAATRFGVRGISLALSLFALSGVWAVSHSGLVSTPGQLRTAVLALQLFLFVIGSSLIFLAVVLYERWAMEANLRSTQWRLSSAEATSMAMVARVDLDGRWLTVPRRLASLLNYPRQELLDRSCEELTHPEDLVRELREVPALLAGEVPSFQVEKRFVRSDGIPVWCYLSRSLIRDPDGRPLHFLDYLTDIDELKRAEAAVARSQSELHLFAERSPAAVAVLDGQLRIVTASRRFRDDFRPDGSPIVGRRYDEALSGFPRRWPEALKRALEGFSDSSEDDSFGRRDGSMESLRWEITPGAFADGRPAGAFLFAELTTERKHRERTVEELRLELAHLMRVSILGELSGALAHELNQPLAAILANAQAAQKYLSRGPSGTKEMAAILEDIVADDLRARDVIQSLRRLLRKEKTEFLSVDLNMLIREVLDLAQSDLITKNVTVLRQLARDLPPIRGDRVQIQQVLLNLIVNACEAMAAGRSDNRKLRILTDVGENDTVHLEVRDSGPGVPLEMRDRIFDPFLTTKNMGLGLGLTICRSLVAAHGGSLWHSDNEAGGASFHVALPRAGSAD
jgi:PAS domain S-box-containing protein